MPGKGDVNAVENAGFGHKRFSGAAFFCGASKEDHRSRLPGSFQIFLNGDRGSQASGSEQVMTAAVAVSAFDDRLFLRDPRLLAQSGEGVKFSEKSDDRLSASIASAECGWNPGQSGPDGKTCFGQGIF